MKEMLTITKNSSSMMVIAYIENKTKKDVWPVSKPGIYLRKRKNILYLWSKNKTSIFGSNPYQRIFKCEVNDVSDNGGCEIKGHFVFRKGIYIAPILFTLFYWIICVIDNTSFNILPIFIVFVALGVFCFIGATWYEEEEHKIISLINDIPENIYGEIS
ncbi:MAG: hypothetical protein VB086_13725 [Clostridiaceae bacterium]|nr:hypothetical protein [Clostridiaceae bacterium]